MDSWRLLWGDAVSAARYVATGVLFSFLVVWSVFAFQRQLRRQSAAIANRSNPLDALPIESLPDWLFFCDRERCQWLNMALNVVWGGSRGFAEERLRALMCKTLTRYPIEVAHLPVKIIASVRDVSIGSSPPEIVSVKAYRPSLGCYMLDIAWRLVSDARVEVAVSLERKQGSGIDRCNLGGEAQQAHAKEEAGSSNQGVREAILTLLERPSLKFEVADIEASFNTRIELKPLVPGVPPFFGSLHASLLSLPVVDFDLRAPEPINVMSVPGVSAAITDLLKVRMHTCNNELHASFRVLDISLSI